MFMKKLFVLSCLIVAVCTAGFARAAAHNVIVSSCGTHVYINECLTDEEILEIYDALEAGC